MLREFLVSHFNLNDLEVLCGDLAIDYDTLPHATRLELADGMMGFFSAKGDLRRLASAALVRRPSVLDAPALTAMLGELPTAPVQRVRLQVTLDLAMDVWGNRPLNEVLAHIAQVGGVDRVEIHALAALPGSVRLLLGVPEVCLPRLLAVPLPQRVNARFSIIRIEPFWALPPVVQAAWQAEFVSRVPGRDPYQRKLNFPKKRGCLGPLLGVLVLIALIIGVIAIATRASRSQPDRPAPARPTAIDGQPATGTPTPTAPSAPAASVTPTPTPTRTPTSTPTRTPTPTPTRALPPADKTLPFIANLQAAPLSAGTSPCNGATSVTASANVSDDRGLDWVELRYRFRARPIKTGDPDPNVTVGPYSAGAQKAGGQPAYGYKAAIDLASLDKSLSGKYSTWTMDYWIVAQDTSGNVAEGKPNSDVTVYSLCGPG